MKSLNFLNIIFFASLLSANVSFGQCYSAVSLDGANDYLHTPFSNYSFNNFTLEMVINSADYNPNEHYISLYQNAYIVLGGWSSGGVFNTWADGLNPISISSMPANTPATGTWHHVAFVYDGNNQLLYIDGALVSSSPTSGAVNITTGFNSGLVIGARYDQNQQYSNTSFEDVRIWTIARSAAEISANINTNLSGNETGLVAYYRFEDGQGSPTVADLSGNGNTLTMYNMDPTTDWIVGPFGSSSYIDNQSACDSYTWSANGQSYTQSGQYTEVLSDLNGCDSTVTLDLTINNSSTGSETVTECDSYTWNTNGQTYTQTGQYTSVLTNQSGCDSTVTLNLTITNSNTGSETVTACDSYTWNTNGQTYTQSGQYTEVLTNQDGCDSTVTLDLTITQPNTGSETVTECDSYTWNTNSQTYTQSGQYTEVLTNQFGCDSTVTLNLTINSSSSSTQTDTGLDSYTWSVNNQTYTQSGTYTAVIPNASGCDSTITLDLTLQFTGLDENESSYVAVYPNPTYSSFTLSTKDMIHMNYSLVDIQGKVVLTGKIESTEETVDISKLSKGQYNLVFEDESISPISIIKN